MSDASETPLRFHAYYYSFEPTGVRAIDLILNAVAWAGKAYHHTESWTEDLDPYPNTQGRTCAEWIGQAAHAAAAEVRALTQRLEEAERQRDEWQEKAEARQRELNDLEQHAVTIRLLMEQRDAALARAEALRVVMAEMLSGARSDCNDRNCGGCTRCRARALAGPSAAGGGEDGRD